MLVVEDDPDFAPILQEVARSKNFKVVLAQRAEQALAMAHELKPDAITLDIILPDLDGWSVLDRLKADPYTRHIPVVLISCTEDRLRGLEKGALAFLTKPLDSNILDQALTRLSDFLDNRQRRLLIVEDQELQRQIMVDYLISSDVEVVAVGSGQESLDAIRGQRFDCVVLDLKLPDMSGFEVLQELQNQEALRELPVVVYTGRDLTKKELAKLNKLAQSIVIKGSNSMERLLAETSVFLHRNRADLPPAQRELLDQLYQSDTPLDNKRVVIVDDDPRNLFALTSVLERHKMKVVTAESGIQAIELLKNEGGQVDVVLMDIMLPEMDGYETMRTIRKLVQFKSLPIIALTAKAMKGDRERCLEAGASDYIAKPVKIEQLLALLRIWLYK